MDTKTKKNVEKKIRKNKFENISVAVKDNVVFLNGNVVSYNDYVDIGLLAGKGKNVCGVVNNIRYPDKQKKVVKKKGNTKIIGKVDVVIIGGGIVGCSIARELSKYKLKTVLVEKNEDVSCGATKANNAMVHSGIGEKPGTLKQKLCVKGHFTFEELSKELNVPYEKCGMLIILTKGALSGLKIPGFLGDFIAKRIVPIIVKHRGKKMGLSINIVKRRELLRKEPNVTKKALVAISSPTYGVTSPYEFAIALAENAVDNGVDIFLNTEVVDIDKKDGKVCSVITTKGTIETQFVINAAGVFADDIAEMVGDREYTIHPRKGSVLIFDKELEGLVSHNLSILKFPMKQHTKGGGIMVTPHGNTQWGPTALEIPNKGDTSVTSEEIKSIFDSYEPLLPNFPQKSIITYFAGVRAPTFTEDFFIQASRKVKGFVHVAGIQSPGIAASPAIAEMVIDILKCEKLELDKKEDFNPVRKKPVILREMTVKERNKLIAKNPQYGRIVCRCEQVSEGEIADAIHSAIPARNIDAIKRRARAGMGRCQAGFCLPKVAQILARETGMSIEEIMKNSDGSHLFVGKAKCLLEEKHDKN